MFVCDSMIRQVTNMQNLLFQLLNSYILIHKENSKENKTNERIKDCSFQRSYFSSNRIYKKTRIR